MSSTYSLQTDLTEAKAMAEGLATYVRGDLLYGNADGGFFSQLPSLTVGALLLRLRRLDALRDEMNDKQLKKLDSAQALWQQTRTDWRLHYEEKMEREVLSRADSMKTFFRECSESMLNCHNNYRPEILKRTMMQEIVREMSALNINNAAVTTQVQMVDDKLHKFMRKDTFQWAEELQSVYPREEFWWLYQKPPKSV